MPRVGFLFPPEIVVNGYPKLPRRKKKTATGHRSNSMRYAAIQIAFLSAKPNRASIPVPSSIRLEGSGTDVIVSVAGMPSAPPLLKSVKQNVPVKKVGASSGPE